MARIAYLGSGEVQSQHGSFVDGEQFLLPRVAHLCALAVGRGRTLVRTSRAPGLESHRGDASRCRDAFHVGDPARRDRRAFGVDGRIDRRLRRARRSGSRRLQRSVVVDSRGATPRGDNRRRDLDRKGARLVGPSTWRLSPSRRASPGTRGLTRRSVIVGLPLFNELRGRWWGTPEQSVPGHDQAVDGCVARALRGRPPCQAEAVRRTSD